GISRSQVSRLCEGTINIGRTVSIKARERFLRRQAGWLRANRHLDVHKQQAHLRLALNGYYQYFGIRLAEQALYSVYRRIRKLWRQQLRRRSERARRTCAWSDLYVRSRSCGLRFSVTQTPVG